MEARYTKVAVCQYSAEAAILRGRLEGNGIRVVVADAVYTKYKYHCNNCRHEFDIS